MKLIKQLETHRNHTLARQKTYKNVTFTQGFAYFLDSCKTDRLVPMGASRVLVNGAHRWSDSVGDGGILFETTEHPMVKSGFAGDVTIQGNKDALELFDRIMRVYEVQHDDVETTEPAEVQSSYHDELNPTLWSGDQLKPEVRKILLKAAEAFKRALKIPDLNVEDVILTGSNANYNWSNASDVDLHLIVDYDDVANKHGDLVEEYFNAKRSVFNHLHEVHIKGHDVEFYVQNKNEKHTSSGLYSIQNDEWIKEPEHKEPDVDDSAVRAKVTEMMKKIDDVTSDCNKASVVEALMEKLKKMRQAGLDASGEFSTENLVFKALRHNGYLEKLATCKTKAFDRELSIEDEAWGWND